MKGKPIVRRMTRRRFLRGVGQGALLTPLLGSRLAHAACPGGTSADCQLRLAATDGFFALPGRTQADAFAVGGIPQGPLYGFGFVQGFPFNASIADLIGEHKGLVQWPSPIIGIDEEEPLNLTMTNLGFVFRPDLDDAHTIHWHGFRNPVALFDGVPEVSIAVPPARNFPYFYPPRREGTYMYHCHFEDVEHVQLGMTGVVFVRPKQNKTGLDADGGAVPVARLGGSSDPSAPLGYAYNDAGGSTAYDREFTLLLNEIDPRPHDNLFGVQEFVWSDYKAVYWLINGRAYPHTLIRNGDTAGEAALLVNEDPSEPDVPVPPPGPDGTETLRQPISSLIQVNADDRVLLRFANLGYEQQSMQLVGIPMRVIGEDATFLRGPNGDDLSYVANTIYVGPGEARDVLFTAPAFVGPGEPDPDVPFGVGANYNGYLLKNRNVHTLHNNGSVDPVTGLGGQVTEVWVYPSGSLPDQGKPNETYPVVV